MPDNNWKKDESRCGCKDKNKGLHDPRCGAFISDDDLKTALTAEQERMNKEGWGCNLCGDFERGAYWGAKAQRTRLKPLRNAYNRLYDSHHEQLSNEALENRKEKVLKEVRKLFE